MMTDGERRIVAALEAGEAVDLRAGDAGRDDPARAAEWDGSRTVRAELLVGLLTSASGTSRPRPVRLRGARITGPFDLEACVIDRPLLLRDCHIEEVVNLDGAGVAALRLPGCRLPGLSAEQLRAAGNLDLNDGFTAAGEVNLLDARIGGRLSFSGGVHLRNPGGRALNADRIDVRQGVSFQGGFVAEGEVRLLGASIGGHLNLSGARLANQGGTALQANWITVGRYMLCTDGFAAEGGIKVASARIPHLDLSGAVLSNPAGPALTGYGLTVEQDLLCGAGFTADGEIALVGAHVGGRLDLDGARLADPGGRALHADSLTVGGSMFCRDGFAAEGELRLVGARIGGVLNLTGARLGNPGGRALYGVRLAVDGDVLCRRGFTAEGEVQLSGARVRGGLELDGARLANPGRVALHAESLTVDQDVTCGEGFTAAGEVRLTGADLGSLDLSGGTLRNPDGYALSAMGLAVGQNLFCRYGFTAEGAVGLVGARIGGRLSFIDAVLSNPRGLALDLELATARALILRPRRRPEGGVDLTNAHVDGFGDDRATWPDGLLLRGFTYGALENDQVAVRARLRMLAGQPGGYAPQPYDQLAAAYRADGREEAARRVAIAKQRHRRKVLGPGGRLANWLLYVTVGYGYRTWLAAAWLAGLLTMGAVLFARAHPHDMTRVDRSGPAFHPVAYTLDVLLPIVDLGQQKAWQPHGAAMYLSWLLIAAGWVLTTDVVAGLTGIIKRD